MRNGLWASLLFLLWGCGSSVDVAREFELGRKLPDKKLPGLLYTRVGAGGLDGGVWLAPTVCWANSCQLLTDENGLVVAKGFVSTGLHDVVPFFLTTRTTRMVLDVTVDPAWYHPPKEWSLLRDPVYVFDWPKVRRKFQDAPAAEQRKLLKRWQDWYEDPSDAPPPFERWGGESPPATPIEPGLPFDEPKPSTQFQRNILDYLMLVSLELQSVPVKEAGAPWGGMQPELPCLVKDLSGAICTKLSTTGLLRQGQWEARTVDGKRVRLRSLGERRFQVCVEYDALEHGAVPGLSYDLAYLTACALSPLGRLYNSPRPVVTPPPTTLTTESTFPETRPAN